MEATMKINTMALAAGTKVWFIRTPEELAEMERRDVESGNRLDSAGEPRLYSQVGQTTLTEDTIVLVTKRSKVEWPTWHRKPKHLTEGIITPSLVPRGQLGATPHTRILFVR